MSGLTPEQEGMIAVARAQAVTRLVPIVRGLSDVLDSLVGAGFSIPGPVVDATEVLAAFGMALAANANGQACPPDAAALLGLAPAPKPPAGATCPDCNGYGTHAPWCPE